MCLEYCPQLSGGQHLMGIDVPLLADMDQPGECQFCSLRCGMRRDSFRENEWQPVNVCYVFNLDALNALMDEPLIWASSSEAPVCPSLLGPSQVQLRGAGIQPLGWFYRSYRTAGRVAVGQRLI